jgi:hypothetical protein
VKSIIVVLRPVSLAEAEEIKAANLAVYSFETTNLDRLGILHNVISLSSEKSKDVQHKRLKYITDFPSRTYKSGTLGGLYQVEGANLWFYNKFRISEEFVKSGIVEAAIAQVVGGIDSITLFLDPDITLRNSKGLEVHKVFPQLKNDKPGISWSNLYQYTKRGIRSLFRNVKYKEHLLLYSAVRRQNIVSLKNEEVKAEFTQLLYLKEQFENKITPLEELPFPELKGKLFDYKSLVQPYEEYSIMAEYITLRKLCNPFALLRVINEVRDVNRKLLGCYDDLLDPRDLWIIKRSLQFNKTNHLHLLRYLGYLDFFKKHTFKSVIAVDENSSLQKVVLDAAKQYGIKTYGIQHGVIHSLHPAYIFNPKDFELFSPVPDKTFLWGKHWQDIAVQYGNYPLSKLAVVGQVRTDVIPSFEQKKGDQPMVIFASQPLFDQELKYQVWKTLFDGMKGVDGLQLVVKPHPSEFQLEAYLSAHFGSEAGNYTIVRDQDLYQMLAACSALITCSSTVAVETIYFHKPIIVLDPYAEDMMGFVKDGLAHSATKSGELKSLLTSALQNDLEIDKSIYDDYLKRYASAIDGQVCQRIMDIVEKG